MFAYAATFYLLEMCISRGSTWLAVHLQVLFQKELASFDTRDVTIQSNLELWDVTGWEHSIKEQGIVIMRGEKTVAIGRGSEKNYVHNGSKQNFGGEKVNILKI